MMDRKEVDRHNSYYMVFLDAKSQSSLLLVLLATTTKTTTSPARYNQRIS